MSYIMMYVSAHGWFRQKACQRYLSYRLGPLSLAHRGDTVSNVLQPQDVTSFLPHLIDGSKKGICLFIEPMLVVSALSRIDVSRQTNIFLMKRKRFFFRVKRMLAPESIRNNVVKVGVHDVRDSLL